MDLSLLNSTTVSNIYSAISSPACEISLSLLSGGIGILGERKFNIVNKLFVLKSRFFNEQADIEMNFSYNSEKDFNLIKKELKNYFIENYPNYRLVNEKSSTISISFDIFTVIVTHNAFNQVFFEVVKTGCGIRNLNSKVRKLISTFDEIDRTRRIFDRLESCEVVVYLPHDLSYIKIYPPNGFTLEDYSIKIQDLEDQYKTKVEVCLNHINASGYSFQEISSLLQRLL